ncbi:MAG: M20/M25/M40 family metallo-hydrolase [Sphaerochaetaceae bacterium]|nr:M20/M25/M40 family metallo-hydrolase [Sphaerochaetaceae bacterium]MDD4258586.1 M20/M25/M40 family metallo-hydrolase [Sphaerochaetaceae bacterium]
MDKCSSRQVLEQFLLLVSIDSPSGKESQIANYLETRLQQLHCLVSTDFAGNIYAILEASNDRVDEEAIALNAHMDTVPLAIEVRPIIENGMIKSDGTSALGADDKAGIAVILTVLELIQDNNLSHPTIKILFTVSEETGLKGAKQVEIDRLGAVKRGYTLDSSAPVGSVIVKAPFKYKVTIVFEGKNAHAGLAPETGISAISIAAKAIDSMHLLRIDEETTANIGTIHGGTNTNIVCDRVMAEVEVRSARQSKALHHIDHIRKCCQHAIDTIGGEFQFDVEESYPGYQLDKDNPILDSMQKACKELGVNYFEINTGGGSDANILRGKSVEIGVIGLGYEKAHTKSESIAISQLTTAVRLVELLATSRNI